jgi:hypothetical protein
MRWILEGTWSGYRSGQERVCHRRILKSMKSVEFWEPIHAVVFTDNTTMTMRIREAKPREKVEEIKGYDALLMDFKIAGMTGYCYVRDLENVKKQGKEAAYAD